jgi:hypothetical protein
MRGKVKNINYSLLLCEKTKQETTPNKITKYAKLSVMIADGPFEN